MAVAVSVRMSAVTAQWYRFHLQQTAPGIKFARGVSGAAAAE